MIGTLVGALTLGSALPSLFSALLPLDWRLTVVAASLCALTAAALINFAALGPRHGAVVRFSPADALRLLLRRSIRLANLGYLGHMWELYAMWAWIGPFIAWARQQTGAPAQARATALLAFLVIASGAFGAVLGGLAADRLGRTTVTIAAMIISGLCAATIGPATTFGMAAVIVIALIWGVTVIADSAQFSAAIAELSDPKLIGTMLTLQTCLGFLPTFVAIQLVPVAVSALGWRYAFMLLAIGPALAGGFELMLACDLAVASSLAVFGEPELKFGAGIVAMLLPWLVGPKVAKGIIFTGADKVSAEEARRLGFVNEVVAPEQVAARAMELARVLARMDPMVLRRTKAAVNRSYEIMGMKAALRAALDTDLIIEGEGAQLKRDFPKVVRDEGLGRALARRDQQFTDGGD